ncbi:hypothetical protein GmHk_20G056700 [Glycine max]|nr:hypothetical protein GmHk_20G056700 [Glycine max]
MWHVNKHNGRQAIDMVLMDHTGAKIGATLWQELFPEFELKLRCGGAYVIHNVKVVYNHFEYKVSTIKYLVYFVKTTSIKEVDRPEIPPNVHVITAFADIISGVAPRDTLVDVVGVVAEVIERKTVNPAYRVTMKLRDNSDAEIIMTVWEEYVVQLDDAIGKNHFVRKPLVLMLTFAKIKEPKDKYPLSVQNIKHGSKLYVNTDMAEIQQFRDRLCVPFYAGGVTDEGTISQSQSNQHSQRNSAEKFLHNAQMVSFGEISRLRQDCYCLTVATVDEVMIDTPWSHDSCPYCTTTFDPLKIGAACCSCQNQVTHTVPRYKLVVKMEQNGEKANFHLWDATCIKIFGKTVDECRQELIASCDEIKVFPACVDELLGKTWAVRFKYRFQMCQSFVLDVSEEEHHIQALTSTLGLQDPLVLLGCTVTYQFKVAFHVGRNLIEIPSLYHRQWAPHYPLYVLLDYNGDKHYIRLRKHNNKLYFADGLKGFRRTMGIHKGVMITFVVLEKNWMFHIHFMPPLHRKTCGRPLTTTRTHVFTIDVTQRLISRTYPLVLPPDALNFVDASTKYMIVLGIHGRRHLWKMTIHNGLQSLGHPWYHYLTVNELMAGDEVVFYYRPNQHVWEVIFRKQMTWNEDESG